MPAHHATLLSLLVSQAGLTQKEQVAAYLECAKFHDEDATLTERTLRRWIKGHIATAPQPAQARVAYLHWGYPIATLLGPPPHIAAGSQTVPPAGTTQPTLTLERQIIMAMRRSARLAALASSTNVSTESLDALRADVAELATDYPRKPAAELIGDLIELQDLHHDYLAGRQRPAQTVELHVTLALVTAMLAKACQDLGRYQQATGFARSMLVFADKAGHTGLQAWAHNLQSLIEFWFGRPIKAIEHANAGLELYPNGQPAGSIASWLAASAARGWASLHNTAETHAALARAETFRLSHRPDDLDDLGGLFAFPLAKQQYYAAGALVNLPGTHADASRAATDALHTYVTGPEGHRSYSDEAGAGCELALARIHSTDLDGARDALTDVLALAPAHRIGGIVTSVQRVHAALLAPALATAGHARALAEEIEAFTRTPATSVLL